MDSETSHQQYSPQQTLQMLQLGNLDISFPITYGILLLGNTKAGKTTTSHLLTHQVLQCGFNDAYTKWAREIQKVLNLSQNHILRLHNIHNLQNLQEQNIIMNSETSHQKSSPEQTLQMLQSGNLDLSFPITYGILLLGNTKAGKTTTSHLLAGQVLQGGLNDAQTVVYQLRNGQERFQNAKIGDKQSVSETQIPNFFQIQEDGKKMFLVDCPGYLDSFGCYRIISNRFFHYQVFSKVENAKFIITFKYNKMLDTAIEMKTTFQQFLGSFSNILQIQNDLINATSIMITGVPRNVDLQKVRQRYKKTPSLGGQFKQIYSKLKQAFLDKNRIFMFPAAKLGQACNTQNQILKDLNKVTTFWKRNKNNKQQLDIKNIKIEITKYIQKEEQQFEAQLKSFSDYYKNNIIKNFQGFIQVIKQLICDNQKYGDSSQYLNKILKINAQMKKKRESSATFSLYKKYSIKRDKMKQNIFKKQKNLSSDSVNNFKDIPFAIVKLKVQKRIQKIIGQLGSKITNDRDAAMLEDKAFVIKSVLSLLIQLAGQTKLKDQKKQEQKNLAVLDFAYEIYKDIQLSNKLFNLVKTNQSFAKKDQNIKKLQKGMFFILVQYPSSLKQIFLNSIKKTSLEILYTNLDKINFNGSLEPQGARQISQLLQQYKNQCLQNQFIQNLSPDLAKQFQAALDNLSSSLCIDGFIIIKKQSNPTLKSLKQMQEMRINLVNQIKENKANAINNVQLKAQNNRIIQFMAECLCKFNKFELALKVYDCLFDGHKVIELLKQKQDKVRVSKKENELLDILIQSMNLAAKYRRTELAMQKAQQAFHIASNLADINKKTQICQFIKKLSNSQCPGSEKYIEFMFNEAPQVILPNDLKENIKSLVSEPSPQKKN